MYLPYAGIGSRNTPAEVMIVMQRIANVLEGAGFTLRSGGADGADDAFEKGVHRNKEIFIPWNGFNRRHVTQPGIYCGWPSATIYENAMTMAAQYHPNWGACSQGARQMHTRNMAQILGHDLKSPSKFVVCWTPNASGSGGTGQALRVAKALGIPIYDLGAQMDEKMAALSTFCEYLTRPELADPR